MANTIEIEAKALVSQADYKKLAKRFSAYPRYTQTNYYIDSQDRALAKDDIALRIRQIGERYELTLKTPLSEGLLEKNCVIGESDFIAFRDQGVFPKGDTSRFLTMLGFELSDLRILTSLTTDRIDVEYEGGLLSLDRNTYSGETDYEIEFEYNNLDGAKVILGKLFEEAGIEAPFTDTAKARRAMDAIDK